MGKIQKLDTKTTNMIAAGEVVERPMGVVKELVENAIDAGSTRIQITVEEGGLSKITVLDNGSGMDSEDAVNAFERHATSKIHESNDLWKIHTLGFRGEALPSIASVSKMTLITSDGKDSTKVQVEYGQTVSVQNYPSNPGTEVTVEGLFYRTPARLKHMRSASYENSLIQDVISRFALCHPEIAFTFLSSGKEALRTTGQGNLLEVIYQIWGKEVAEHALPFACEDYDYQVSGYLIKPEITRSSRNHMHVFLNNRMVRTYRLYKAIQDGYEDFIVKGRFPLVVIKVEIDNQLLDVNVHPSKWEVRLSKERQLEELIVHQVRETLKNSMLAPITKIEESKPEYYEPLSFEQELYVPYQPTQNVIKEPISNIQPKQEKEPDKENQVFPDLQVIGQLHGKLILCACEQGLAIIDQHAAQERVHYEEIRASLNQNPSMMECLIPITIHTTNDLVSRLSEINDSIEDFHFQFEAFGPDTLIVREVPLWMNEIEEEPFFQDVLDQFKDQQKSSYAKMEKKKIATMACHHSIRFHRNLTMQEMEEVVRQLSLCENPYHCPHGRPTFMILEEKELMKGFLR